MVDLAKHVYHCEECDDRTCKLETSKKPAADPETCTWSNLAGKYVYASWARRVSPADIQKPKETESDG